MSASEATKVKSKQGYVDFKNVFRFSGAILAALIGSGFASGQEILQFFTVYGKNSIFASLIALVLFSAVLGILVSHGYRNSKGSVSNVYEHYLGNVFGKFMKIYTPIFAFLIGVVTISGAGASINQYFGISNVWGTVIMSAAVLASVLLGFDRLIDILSSFGPLIIIISLFVGGYTLIMNPVNIDASTAFLQSAENLPYGAGNNASFWWLGGILFVAYNIIGGVPFVTRLGSDANSQREGLLGGVLGGVGLILSALVMNLAMLNHAEEMLSVEVPVLRLAQNIGPVMGGIFILILLTAIFTTAGPFLWTVSDAILPEDTSDKKKKITIIIISLAILVGAQLPFRTLVGIVYPFSGYFGIALIVSIISKNLLDIYRAKQAN